MPDRPERFPKEKRRSPRVSGAIVEYFIDGQNPDRKKAFIKDLCIHGICIYIPHAVGSDAVLCMYIFLFGSNVPIFAKGRVVWQKPADYVGFYNVGCEFMEMNDEGRKRLADHIKANYQKPEDHSDGARQL